MCTVVIEVPASQSAATRVLAVRDEDPARPWDPPGRWWDAHPDTLGVRDRRANGAWLAARPDAGRLAVIVNRAAEIPEPVGGFASRGGIVLDAVAGRLPHDRPGTAAFTLIEVDGAQATAISWDGTALRRERLSPGIHMLAHHEIDDERSERIARWLPEFRALVGAPEAEWRERWLGVLARSGELPPTSDEAIVRDNRHLGYPTLSLLTCLAEVRGGAAADRGGEVYLEWAALAEPGRWGAPEFASATAQDTAAQNTAAQGAAVPPIPTS